MLFWQFSLILSSIICAVISGECHNWCDYGILNEDCKCDCFSKHITGEHCERAKIIRCLIASGDGSCPEYYYCHADNDVCNRGLCSPDALGWCIPLPITELQTNGNQRRMGHSFKAAQMHRRHLRATRNMQSAQTL